MARFIKRPVKIEAVRVAETLANASNQWSNLEPWIIDAYEEGGLLFLYNAVEIITKEGVMRGEKEDWIIRGIEGELYPCKPEIFAKTYDLVPG